MKKRSLYNRFNVFGTLLFVTLLPCFLATAFLALVFVPMMSNTAAGNDAAYENVLLASAATQFEDLQKTMDELVAVVEHNTWIRPLLIDTVNGKRSSAATRDFIAAEMNQACIRAEVKSFSFRFYDDTVVYNNRGALQDPEASISRNDQYIHHLQYHFFASETQEQTFSTIRFDGVDYLLYQTPFRDIDGGRYKGEINILLQSSVFGAKLNRATGSDAAAFRITDLDGNSLWEYNTKLFEEKTVTLSQLSDSGNYYFCVEIPESIHNQTRSTVVPDMLVTLVLSLAISACISYVLTRASYRPIERMVQKFVGQNQGRNDFDAMEQVFDRVLSEKDQIQTSLARLRPIAQQKVIGSLLDGTAVLNDGIEDEMAHCHLEFRHERFNVIYLEAPFSQLQEPELAAELAMQTLLEHLAGSLPLQASLYCHDVDHYRILVNYSTWEVLQAYLSQLGANCKAYFQKHALGDGVHIGVGHAVFSIDEIYRAAEQAETAFNVAVLNRLDQPMFYRELESELSNDYFYPLSEEMLFSRAITNCNTESAKSILYNIIEENRRRTQLNPKCLPLLYMDLSSTVARSGQSLGIVLPPTELRESFISLDEIRLRLEITIDGLCYQIMNRRQKSMNRSEEQILDYIDQHMYDPDLSLNSVAERFKKSPAYISLLFKEHKGTNYNSYINQQRILRAMHLINDEKMDANQVYPLVGYVSLSTFRRNFTKYAKCNPGAVTAPED